jgi:dipeptidyl aminopeptidase/acylaminoacyl peptidase
MASATTPLIPRAVIFGNPEKAAPAISPDGTRMAYLAPVNGVLNVWVGPVGSDDFKPVTNDTDRGISSYHWAANNRDLLYIQDKGGDENWRLYGVDLESGETSDFTPFEGVQAQVIEIDKHRPDSVLVALNKDNPQLHDVYELHLRSGELEKVAENPGFVGWVVDSDFVVRCGVGPTPDGGFVIMVRDSADSQWRPLAQVGQEDALTTSPVAFTLDGKAMVMLTSQGVNAGRLVKVDATTGEVLETIAEDPIYDVTSAMIHPDTREIQMVTFLKARAENVVIDPSIQDDIDGIRALHNGDFDITGRDHADTTWLVLFTTDDGPVAFYAWDRRAKQGTFLFESRPELKRYPLSKMEPFSFTTRDGLTVHGYLTFPPDLVRW